ncbi:MAG: VOC family protein [bacterium]|nr:VOC family protein [bacterium]
MPDLPEHLEPLNDLIQYLDHVAIGVHDVGAAAGLFEMLGGTFLTGADNRRGGFRWLQYRLPGSTRIEALAPVSDDCFLWRFLRSRGEGLHHLTFRVSSVAEAARQAEGAGLDVVGLYINPGGWSECFIHPSSASGTLIQLADWTDDYYPQASLSQVLAGEVIED